MSGNEGPKRLKKRAIINEDEEDEEGGEDEEEADSDDEQQPNGTRRRARSPRKKTGESKRLTMDLNGDRETTWDTTFDSIHAMCLIASRLYELPLLPPHSRTLNYSALKRLLTSVALQSNRKVTDYYAQYVPDKTQDTAADGFDLHQVGDAEIRRHKRSIQEYVDRTTHLREFLELEAIEGSFSATFNEAELRVKTLAGNPYWRDPLNLFEARVHAICNQTPKWDDVKTGFIDIMVRHADIRGNWKAIPEKWQNRVALEGAKAALEQEKFNDHPESLALTAFRKNPIVRKALQVGTAAYNKSIATKTSTDAVADAAMAAAQSAYEARIEAPVDDSLADKAKQARKLAEITAGIAAHAAAEKAKMDGDAANDAAVKAAARIAAYYAAKAASVDHDKALAEANKAEQRALASDAYEALEPTADETVAALSNPRYFHKSDKYFNSIKNRFVSKMQPLSPCQPGAHTDDPVSLTLLDIAILGGLHPRTFALTYPTYDSNKQLLKPLKPDVFFNKCLPFFQDTFLGPDVDSSFNRDADLGYVLFNIQITAKRIRHAFYDSIVSTPLNFVGTAAQFGAPGRKREAERNEAERKNLRGALRDDYAWEKHRSKLQRVDEANPSKRVFQHPLEKYCLECLEAGTAVYYRLTASMLEARLAAIKRLPFPDTYISAFAKLMANLMIRNELHNPTIRAQSTNQARLNMRHAEYGILEALCQIADACNLQRPVHIT